MQRERHDDGVVGVPEYGYEVGDEIEKQRPVNQQQRARSTRTPQLMLGSAVTLERFTEIRAEVGSRQWAALYLGAPTSPEGGLIKREWIDGHRLIAASRGATLAVDPADSGEGDETGIVAGSHAREGRVALTHDISAHMTSETWASKTVGLAAAIGAMGSRSARWPHRYRGFDGATVHPLKPVGTPHQWSLVPEPWWQRKSDLRIHRMDEPDIVELGELRAQIHNGIASQRPMRDITFDLFRDDNGDPRMLHSAVLFLDTIGTTAASIAADASENLKRFHRAINLAAMMAGTEEPNVLQASTWFTDNLVVALPVAAHQSVEYAAMYAALTAAELAVGLLLEGILTRGGITVGRVYLDNRFVFGPALIAAHNLEQTTAEPRILLSEDIAAALMHDLIDVEAIEKTGSSPYRVYRDDAKERRPFVNHFDIAFSGREPHQARNLAKQLASPLAEGYESANDERQRAKWNWARRRFEEAVGRWCSDCATA